MLIVGAGGYAFELLKCLELIAGNTEIAFYNDVARNLPERLVGRFPILRSEAEAKELLVRSSEFALGLGGTVIWHTLAQKFQHLCGQLIPVIAGSANIGSYDVVLGYGLNVMQNVLISSSTQIERGTLINAADSVHHNTVIGRYCVWFRRARACWVVFR